MNARPRPSDLVLELAELILPRRCLGCREVGPALCRRCARPALGHRFIAGVGPVFSAGEYRGGLSRAIVHYKERDRRDLTGALAGLLSFAAAAALRRVPFDVVVAVPSRPRAARDRGGDHLRRLLARADLPAIEHGPLRIVRTVADTAGLDRAGRRRNLAGAFAAWGPDGRPTRVLLVDDVVTSGATLGEAARALGAAGWSVSGAAVVAATPRR